MSEKIIIKGKFLIDRVIKNSAGNRVEEIEVFSTSEFNKKVVASDGYHTFEELYDHRITLFTALCKHLRELSLEYGHDSNVWRSKINGDGTTWDGWFIMGIGKDKGKQITYHLPLSRWSETDFAETLDQAPEWDGHSSADVLERLKKL